MIDGMRTWVMSSNMIATTKSILDKNGSWIHHRLYYWTQRLITYTGRGRATF